MSAEPAPIRRLAPVQGDQLGLIERASDKPRKWWQIILVCGDCNRTTARPPRGSHECAWCRGRLAEVVRA